MMASMGANRLFIRAASVVRTSIQRRYKRAGLHPRLREITLILSDGSTVKTSTSFQALPTHVQLHEDIKNQVPFVKTQGSIIDKSGQIAKFERRFARKEFVIPDAVSAPSGGKTTSAADDDEDDDDWW
eukprot:m.45048 g.45048  ORF g.45048 m.45048 type:complete len:128 (-) comp15109_c0_seq1:366-749(-)